MDMFSVSPQILSMRHVLGTCVVRTYLFPGLKKHRRTRSRLNGSFCNVYSDCCLYLPNGLKPCCLFFPLIDHSQPAAATGTGTTEDTDRSKV